MNMELFEIYNKHFKPAEVKEVNDVTNETVFNDDSKPTAVDANNEIENLKGEILQLRETLAQLSAKEETTENEC